MDLSENARVPVLQVICNTFDTVKINPNILFTALLSYITTPSSYMVVVIVIFHFNIVATYILIVLIMGFCIKVVLNDRKIVVSLINIVI